MKLWLRADSIKLALPKLVGTPVADQAALGDVNTLYGNVTVTA